MTKLGIIGAMDIEVQTLKENMENLTSREKAGTIFYEGVLEGLPVVLVQCGIGKVNAAICTQILCDCGVSHIVNTGIAGSLSAALDIGDMVVSRELWHHDFDCVAFGYPMCKIPGMPQSFAADSELMALAETAAAATGAGVHIGAVASGDQFVASAELKQQIVTRTGALCTEMEGAAIAQTAFRNQVSFVVLRCISDKADNSAQMDYPSFEAMAAKRCAQVVMTLARMLRNR